MRSAHPFKDAISETQQLWMLQQFACLKMVMNAGSTMWPIEYADGLDFLQRFEQDDRVEDIWRKLCAAVKKHSEGELDDVEESKEGTIAFIVALLALRFGAEALNLEALESQQDQIELDELKKIIAQDLGATKSTPEYLEMLARATELLAEEAEKNVGARGEEVQRVLSTLPRSGASGSRARKIFNRQLSSFIHTWTGRWFDDEVAVFAQIVFDRRDIDAENVRAARKPTTRKGRFHKGK